jgi:hypothetical protein
MKRLLEQSEEAAKIANDAFAAGNLVVGIAALKLAAQLVQIARLLDRDGTPDGTRPSVHNG